MPSTSPRNPLNSFVEPGAEKLARRIRRYWADQREHVPNVWVEHVSVVQQGSICCIRSDMRDGWPAKRNEVHT